MFISLPLLIVILIDFSRGNYLNIFNKADWSYCVLLFGGQLIIKLVSALLKIKGKIHWQFVAFLLTLIITIFMTPAAIFIVVIQSSNVLPQLWIKIVQVVLYVFSIFAYFQIAGYAQEKDDNADTNQL
jgi:glucan phosphoethanolaminetransferase (alkaline phosphatase superfamily)